MNWGIVSGSFGRVKNSWFGCNVKAVLSCKKLLRVLLTSKSRDRPFCAYDGLSPKNQMTRSRQSAFCILSGLMPIWAVFRLA